ncbi:class I SAM-dependent methyltransferase [Rugamonas apoptosis]|uniref:Class I SAM-dependent methyltransferase n=1 Tax=Rugamonas apoptosis TaxID=2758570 RepID=A0A7W2IKD4_9BURK|nr:class I SAM-dependent methyltransferase [Rugamonas apoptosis]MBA5687287.1 class I SAM-dependent methyltransferase [Rugamonas apoptosis]
MSSKSARDDPDWDTSCQDGFYRHYEQQSGGEADWHRFQMIHAALWRALGQPAGSLRVGDIGCGAGTQCRLWAGMGHRVQGVDINEALIGLARQRAQQAGLEIQFAVASATALPWDDGAMDVCVAPELLEHVTDWTTCLSEMVRVLRPGGALFISTSNKLCPSQEEFSLPLYSWYPAWLKHHCEHLARTTHPQLAAYATYPAVNWFTYYGLRQHLGQQGLHCMDRFDMMDLAGRGRMAVALVRAIRRMPPLRWLAHVATPYTVLLGIKPAVASGSARGASQSAMGPRPTA